MTEKPTEHQLYRIHKELNIEINELKVIIKTKQEGFYVIQAIEILKRSSNPIDLTNIY